MNNSAYERITYLEYRCRRAEEKVRSFESGEEFRKLSLGRSRLRRYYERCLAKKDQEIQRLHIRLVSNREMWFDVFSDIQSEHGKELRKKNVRFESLRGNCGRKTQRSRS